jgi:hypothetical protein
MGIRDDGGMNLNRFSRRNLLVGLVFGLGFPVHAMLGQGGQPPATVMIIRHAEKPTDGQIHLSPTGFKRAELIPGLFLPGSVRGDLAVPQVLIATHQSAHSNREVETVMPLSTALKLPVDDSVMDEDFAALATDLLSGKYAGKVVLVSWHHGRIPQLAAALGVKPPYEKWPDEQFDRVWRIDWQGGKAKVVDLPQGLMPGDSK